MDRVLEVLGKDSTDAVAVAVTLVSPHLLESTQEQPKHKFKTKVSALLKSSGQTRAYGAVLARKALADWSIVKSHGGAWAAIMLHVLDLPDEVCWAPVTKTLTYLFGKVHGKSELSREIAGSKIGEFMKRLVKTLPSTHAVYAAREMLRLYPTQCRPTLNKLEPVLRAVDPSSMAYLCLAEKQGAEIWAQRVGEHIALLNEHQKLDEIELASNLRALHEYIIVAAAVNAKIPVQPLIAVVLKLLSAFKPAASQFTCEFIRRTFPYLKVLYIEQFERLVFALGDCLEMGTQEAVDSIEVITMLTSALGWVPENYHQLYTRLTKRTLHLFTREGTSMCAQGIADFVQSPSAFTTPTLNDRRREVLLAFLTAVIFYAPGIPQSCRTQVDRIILSEGSSQQIALAALYPAKYSILPLAIERLPELGGLETLVHPRFPPLNTPKHMLDSISSEEVSESTFDAVPEPQPEESGADDAAEEESLEQKSLPLPKMPEYTKMIHKSELETPPEKRVRTELSNSDLLELSSQQNNIDVGTNDGQKEDDGGNDEDELVIPTLNMDSD